MPEWQEASERPRRAYAIRGAEGPPEHCLGFGAYEPIVEITSEIHEALVVALDGRPGQRWLDIGTGTGAVALRTARTGAEVTGSTWRQP